MIAHLPVFSALSIQTNSHCNLRCDFCYYGQYMGYDNDTILETSVVEKILCELAEMDYSGRIAFYNMNEPLTDSRLLDFLVMARDRVPKSRLFLSTNGLLLDQGTVDALLTKLDHLRVNRYHDLPALDFTHPKIEVQDKWDFSNRASNNRGGALTGLPMAAQASDSPCANPFGHLVIMPPGVAVLCCSDGFKQYPTGDIRKQTLQQIWHGEAFRRVRRLLATGRRSQISPCSGCSVAGGCFLEYFQEPERYSDMIHQYGLP